MIDFNGPLSLRKYEVLNFFFMTEFYKRYSYIQIIAREINASINK